MFINNYDLIIFAILVSLIIFYFVFGKIMEQSIVHNAQQLVKYPIGLNILTDLGTFQKINLKTPISKKLIDIR